MAKRYKIEYTPSFMVQLHEILFYIRFELQNDVSAENLMNEIIDKIEKRSLSPESYKVYKTFKNGKIKYYRLNVKSYSIFYEVENSIMKVNAIFYSGRNLDNLL